MIVDVQLYAKKNGVQSSSLSITKSIEGKML